MLKKIYHYLLSVLFYWFYGRPSRKLIIIGVTGTKGKSTTCRFIASVLQAGGHKVGLLSTVEFQIGDKRWLNLRKMTMLGRGEIHKMLQQMVEAGCKYAVVETSSEGILQYRHLGLNYDIAVFTNLGTEHSERHGGFKNLKRDKGKLFASLTQTSPKIINDQKIPKIIVANVDDANSEYYLNFSADKKIKYSTLGPADVVGQNIKSDLSGTNFTVDNKNFHLNLVGEFNVPNALAAIAVGRTQNISEDQIIAGLASIKVLEGHMEFIEEGQPYKIIVDYAHEPLSFTALFNSLNTTRAKNCKLIAIIGSDGGGRDIGKREKMGEIAGKLCDIVIVTDVNCFDEDPSLIAEMLAKGVRSAGKKDGQDLFVEIDRRAAITMACNMAKVGDVIVITAKGTEPCIIQAHGKRIPWDDRNIAREILRQGSL